MLNKAIIMGRLTRDPEVKQTQSGISMCKFSVAVDRDMVNKATGERDTDFLNITSFRSTADFVGKYFQKGSLIALEGRIQVSNYTDKEGNKRTSTDIVAEHVYFAGSKKKDAEAGAPSAPAPSAAPAQAPDLDESEGDLPF